ncbi:hypothetical protein GF351_01210 [Candidatus Woesearchaeota archaeon]|nr:hypothetical protein [Candidatus Woesearchaeota archaeon]
MGKKRILVLTILLALVVVLLSLLTSSQGVENPPGCCVRPGIACDDTLQSNCVGDDEVFYPGQLCSELGACQEGCCLTYLTEDVQGTLFCRYTQNVSCNASDRFTYFTTELDETECEQCSYAELFGDVSGRVFYNRSMTYYPAQGAEVSVFGEYTDTASQSGNYLIEDVPAGEVPLEAIYPGYVPVVERVEIFPGQEVFKDIYINVPLAYGTGNVTGIVTYQGQGISNIEVKCKQDSDFTDQSGTYRIEDVEGGTMTCTAIGAPVGYHNVSKTVTVQAGVESIIDFSLDMICGDGIIQRELGEECDGQAPNNCTGPCVQSTCQCPDTCAEANPGISPQFVCFAFEYQCERPDGYDSLDTSCGTGLLMDQGTTTQIQMQCCNGSVQELPECAQVIRDTELSPSEPICVCGDYYVNSSKDRGFCCQGVYSADVPCATGDLRGYVRNQSHQDEEIRLPNSYVLARQDFRNFRAYATETGEYFLENLPVGIYNITAVASGYENKTETGFEIEEGVTKELNFLLDPLNDTCYEYIPAPRMVVKPVKGELAINVSWKQQCAEDVLDFYLYRDGELVARLEPEERMYMDLGTGMYPGLEWDTGYTYTLEVWSARNDVEYDTNTQNFLVYLLYNHSQKVVYSGDQPCEGHYDNVPFCLDENLGIGGVKILKVYCDVANLLVHIQDCSQQGEGEICVGPDEDMQPQTRCVQVPAAGECSGKGIPISSAIAAPYNVFGLFYQEYMDDCENTDLCYYDYSSTITDVCKGCDLFGSCFSYRSRDACESDECIYGSYQNTDCQWYEGPYGELGMGVCYPEGQEGTEYCHICNWSSPMFDNVCNQGVCDLLGDCYSDIYNASCVGCDSTVQCNLFDYDSCGNYGTINEDQTCGSSYQMPQSEDPCGLGICNWIDSECQKDGNMDGIADCSLTESDTVCRRSRRPETRIIQKPDYINSQGQSQITFARYSNLQPEEVYTFYCLESEGNSTQGFCCPSEAVPAAGSIQLPNNEYPLEGAEGEGYEGGMFLRYYSSDRYNNTEQIRSETLYVDTKPPVLELGYKIVQEEFDDHASNLMLEINTSEPVLCDYELTGSMLDGWGHAGAFGTEASATETFAGLKDGMYTYEIQCGDYYGNKFHDSMTIFVDRHHGIFYHQPNTTVRRSQALISLRTISDLDCWFNSTHHGIYSGWEKFNRRQINTAEGLHYEHWKDLSDEQLDGTYNLPVVCGEILEDPALFSNIIFTVDETPPNITVQHYAGGALYPMNGSGYYSDPAIAFVCADKKYAHPGEFGCNLESIIYCLDQQDCNAATGTSYTYGEALNIFAGYGSGSYDLYVRGWDLGGNQNKSTIRVNIDKENPLMDILTPENLTIVGPEDPIDIEVKGNIRDDSGAEVTIRWYNEQNVSAVNASVFPQGAQGNRWTFSENIDLFEGANVIEIWGRDKAIDMPNLNFTYLLVFRDVFGPNITGITEPAPEITNHHGRRVDMFCPVDAECGNAELLKDIYFNLTIRDDRYTYDVAEANLTIIFEDGSEQKHALISHGSDIYSQVLRLDQAGNYRAVFTAKDSLGNKAVYETLFTVSDGEGPIIENITIDCPPLCGNGTEMCLNEFGEAIVPARLNYNCTVTVQSDEPLHKIEEFGYRLSVGEVLLTGGTQSQAQPNIFTFYNGLHVPLTEDFQNLQERAEFYITAVDRTGNNGETITSGKYFEVDTFAPDIALIKPTSDRIYGKEKIDFLGYTINTEGNDIYAEPDHAVYIEHYVIHEYSGLDYNYTQLRNFYETRSAPKPVPIGQGSLVSAANMGNTSLTVTDPNRYFLKNLTAGTRSYVRIAGYHKADASYYELDTAEISYNSANQQTTLVLRSPLETDIPAGVTVSGYNNSYAPSGWFKISNISITGGHNILHIYSADKVLNRGGSQNISVINDEEPFFVINRIPHDGEVINGFNYLEIFLEDKMSSIDLNTINVTIEGPEMWSNVTCEPAFCYSSGRKVNITIASSRFFRSFEDGEYHATISGRDELGNEMIDRWSFTIDRFVPDRPDFRTVPGQAFEKVWYSSDSTPMFGLGFGLDEGISVTRSSIREAASVPITCSESQGDNDLECTPVTGVSDSRYHFVVEARETGGNRVGTYIYPFVVDTTYPQVLIDRFRKTLEPIVNISFQITEKSLHYYQATGDIVGTEKVSQDSIAVPLLGDHYMDVNLTPGEEGLRTLQVTAYDRAGNAGSDELNITYDSELDFVDWSPRDYSTDDYRELMVTVDRKAYCTYKGDIGGQVKGRFGSPTQGKFNTYVYKDYVNIPEQDGEQYSLRIECKPLTLWQENKTLDITFKVYTIPPSLNVTSPSEGDEYTRSVTNLTGVITTQIPDILGKAEVFLEQVSVNEQDQLGQRIPVTENTFNIPILLYPGTNKIEVRASDVAGNEDIQTVYDVTYTGRGPSVEWIEPDGSVNQKISSVRAKLIDEENIGLDIPGTRVLVMNQKTGKRVQGSNSKISEQILAFIPNKQFIDEGGIYRVVVEPKDTLGYGQARTGYFTIDPLAPYIELKSPNNVETSGEISFEGSITSEVYIIMSRLLFNGSFRDLGLTGQGGDFSLDYELDDGEYSLEVTALDDEGHHSDYARNFIVDSTEPEVVIVIS